MPWITPAISAGAIAREREMKTWDLLQSTTLGEPAIVLGKFFGSLALLWPALLLLLLLSPFQAIGGINVTAGQSVLFSLPYMAEETFDPLWLLPLTLILAAGVLKTWSRLLFHTSIGLFLSTLCQSAGTAIALTYGALLTVRAAFWLLDNLAYALFFVFAGVMEAINWFLFGSGTYMLLTVAAEVVGTVALLGASVWRLQQ